MLEVSFVEPTLEWPNHPFPKEVASRPYILYHGTSDGYEPQIDLHGLEPAHPFLTRADVMDVLSVFEALNWYSPARTALEPYSAGHDFDEKRPRAIHFAEGVLGALPYATAANAGGEVAGVLRRSLDQLWTYASDEDVRSEHLQQLRRQTVQREVRGIEPPRLPSLSSGELTSLLRRLETLRERVNLPLEMFDHGVVYAVEFECEDFPLMADSRSMGVEYRGALAASRIVAKLRVPTSYKHNRLLRGRGSLDVPAWSGILRDLKSRGRGSA